jgi:hypothetical protein
MRSRVSIIGTRRRGNFPLADRDQNRAIPNTRPKTVTVEVGGWFISLTGRWLGGRARPDQLRAVVAWSYVPVLATIPIWIIQLGLLGRELFTRETPTIDANPTLGFILLATGILKALLGFWSFVILLKGVGEVQGFSAWKALTSLVLIGLVVFLLIFVPIVLVLAVVALLSH